MIAARLNYRIILKRPRPLTLDFFGEETLIFEEVGRFAVERKEMGGASVKQAGEIFTDYHATFILRWHVSVAVGWRVVDEDGIEYEVTSCVPNRRRGLREIKCNRVNE